MSDSRSNSRLAALGPGLLFAGTAVGVSHLVQSTRAGAGFGMSLLLVVLLANALKYPAFEAGSRYASATGRSLLQAYRGQGKWALWVFLLITVGTMFTVLGAVTIVTAGMASALISDQLGATAWSVILLLASAALLAGGKFRLLENAMKILMLALTLSTVFAVVLLLGRIDLGSLPWWPPLPELSPANIGFLVALVGWMPTAIDIAVWQSLWTLEKSRSDGRELDVAASHFDFKVGYVGTTILAVGFIFLGAGVLYGNDQPLPNSGGAFAVAFVDMYAEIIGDWTRPIVLVAAFSTMLSTTVTVADGFPRALETALARLSEDEVQVGDRTRTYWIAMVVVSAGALLLIANFAQNLKGLVDLATTLSFLTAPIFAWLNFRAVNSPEVAPEHRPQGAYRWAHLVGIVFMTGFALYYISTLLGG